MDPGADKLLGTPVLPLSVSPIPGERKIRFPLLREGVGGRVDCS